MEQGLFFFRHCRPPLSRARFSPKVAGTQGGKTVLGPYWLYRESEPNLN